MTREPSAPNPAGTRRDQVVPILTAVLPAIVVTVIWSVTTVTEANFGFDTDGCRYGAMAFPTDSNESLRLAAPWCWRVVTPLLARSLPVHGLLAFQVLGFAATFTTLTLVLDLLSRETRDTRLALTGFALYVGVFWTVKLAAFSPAFVDAETQLFLVAMLWTLRRGWFWALPPLLAVGVLQKESLFTLAPVGVVAFAVRHGWRNSRLLVFAASCAVACVVPLEVVRVRITPINEYSMLATTLDVVWQEVRAPQFWPRFFLEIWSGLGLIPAILVVGYRRAIGYLRTEPVWLAALVVSAPLVFGGVDKARLMLPLVLPLVMACLPVLASAVDSGRAVDVLWLLATLVLHFHLGHQLTPLPNSTEYYRTLAPIHWQGPLDEQVWTVTVVLTSWGLLTWIRSRAPGSRPAVVPA